MSGTWQHTHTCEMHTHTHTCETPGSPWAGLAAQSVRLQAARFVLRGQMGRTGSALAGGSAAALLTAA